MKGLVGSLIVLLLAGSAAHAGIVITKKGKVFVGRIEASDVTEKSVVLRPKDGALTFDRKDIRWFDEKSDEPTDAYCKLFLDEPLELPWTKYLDNYREAITNRVTVTPLPPRLVVLPLTRTFVSCELSIRYPIGWTVTETSGIVMFESPDKRARIHVFASDLAGDRAFTVTKKSLEKIGTKIDVEKTTTVGGRAASEWESTFTGKKRTVKALRRFVQTERSTAFAAAYADERDYPALVSLLRESLETLRAREQ
jgi:hypothetical protein